MSTDEAPPIDPILNAFVKLVEASAVASLGVTFTVGGAFITGDLISALRYAELLGQQVSQGLDLSDSPLKEGMIEGMITTAQSTTPHYIHLANAQVVASGHKSGFPEEGALWRIRASSIDSFVLGRAILQS